MTDDRGLRDRRDEGVTVTDNPARRRYEIMADGRRAMLTYERSPGTIELIHTEVPSELREHGLASALARRALDDARDAGVRVIATCPYVRAYIERHPKYRSLVEESGPPPEEAVTHDR